MTSTAVRLSRPVEEFARLGTLIRSILRRDRFRLLVWLMGVVLTIAAAAQAMGRLYPDPHAASTVARAQLMATPTGQAFGGPGYGIFDYTLGAIMMNELLMSTLIVVAIMSVLLVTRWTRGDEETGRGELVGAACTGRSASLAAALVVGFGLNLAIALGLTAGLMAQGLALAGSAAFGLGAGLTGCFFVGVGAVTAQVFTTARGASGGGMAVMGLFYMIRVAGDIGHAQQRPGGPAGSPLSWFSPFAWPLQTRAFVDLRWWPLAIPLILGLVLAALATHLLHRRDFAAGLVQPRRGRAQAKAWLNSPLALLLRLERGSFAAWALAAGLLGLSCGYIDINGSFQNLLSGNPTLQKIWGQGQASPADTFFAILLLYGGVFGIAFAVNAIGHMRSSEVHGLAELQLSTAVSRAKLLATAMAVGLVGGAVILVLTALTLGLGGVPVNQASWAALLKAALALIPALAVFVGLAAALFGWLPRAIALMWFYLIYSIIARMFGAVFNLPTWAVKASVLAATPGAPAEPITATPLIIMTLIGLALGAAGYFGYRRRDLAIG
ncbi:MAG: hypothetical protein FWD29_09565 [Micrococcales bacterium]|nr:hypothetical protein [Micrococcales bacterium]